MSHLDFERNWWARTPCAHVWVGDDRYPLNLRPFALRPHSIEAVVGVGDDKDEGMAVPMAVCHSFEDKCLHRKRSKDVWPCVGVSTAAETRTGCKPRNSSAKPVDRRHPATTKMSPSAQDYPLDLSILLGGGKETNKDPASNGE